MRQYSCDNRWSPTAFSCKGQCDKLGGIKRPPRNMERVYRYRYVGDGRYCRRCERYFVKDLVEQMDRQVYCPCCRAKTTGRYRHPAKEELVVSH